MAKQKKILHILQTQSAMSFQIGQEYLFFLLLYALAEYSDYELTVITPGYNPLLEKLKNYNVNIHYFDFRKINILKTVKRLREFADNRKFDAIHSHDFFSNFIVALAFWDYEKKITIFGSRYSALFPQFMEFKNYLFKHLKAFVEKKIINFNNYTFCITKNILSDYLNADIPPGKMTFIKPGIDYLSVQTDENETQKIRKRALGINTKQIKIVCMFARFERLKNGFDVFAKIVETMKIEHSGAPLKFAVFGEQSEALQNYLIQRGINDDVAVIENYYSNNDVLQAIDIILMPYRYCDFPMQLLKAQKFIKPAVVSDIPALNEIINDGVNGYVLPVADYLSFTEKIFRLAADEKNYNEMCENIKNAPKKYSLKEMVYQYLDYYRKLIK